MEFQNTNLPTNLEAEQAVLAAILVNNRALERLDFLRPEHFTHPAHMEIYKLALRQFAAGIPFDLITAKNYLEQGGTLESVGGVKYLADLSGAGLGIMNVEGYGRVIYENFMRRELISLGKEIADSAFVEDLDNGIDKQISSAEAKLFDLGTSGTIDRGASSMGDALRAALIEAEIAYKSDGGLSGLTTGLRDLDKQIGGLHKSDLVIIAGRPAMGKTTVAMNIAFNAAREIYEKRANKNFTGAVVFFSLEMSASQLAGRILSSTTEIPGDAMRKGTINDTEFMKMSQASEYLANIPLFIDDTPGMSVSMMRTRSRRLHRKHGGLALIVIDYLQLMQSDGGRKSDNRVQELSEITRKLKMLAKELEVPVIALSQLSRNVESKDRSDKRPQLSDLRDSGSIEQDADIVMFTYREEYYLQGRDPAEKLGGRGELSLAKEHDTWIKRLAAARGKGELIIGKQRHGPIGSVLLRYQAEYSLFSDLNMGPVYDAPGAAPAGASIAPIPDMADIPEDL
ncbi:MAG: replicative DNA helicase [Rickettsiales bacterium]|jgi:replicative DNA helicase|nr:replicative DNA helicase [Rickettsiales bacterium]